MGTIPGWVFFVAMTVASACIAQQPGQSIKAVQGASKPASQKTPAQHWESLLDAHRVTQATSLCTSWTKSSDLSLQVEAQKCLANVALCKGSQLSLQGNETGGGTLGEGYTSRAVDEALIHLNEGLRLAPQDVTIHQGRLHVLEVAGRFHEMANALDQSATIYKGPGTPDIWLAYAAELANSGEPTAGLRISEVLEKHYPDNSDVIGNLGAFHNMLKQWDQGLPYIRRAVELNPTDPIDTWNLGWTLSKLDRNEEADLWMSKSIQLDANGDNTKERKCLYGQFLVAKLKKSVEGCKFVMDNCETEDRAACKDKDPAAKPPSS